jgi:ATP-dependent protease ClpP protease subunit
MRLPNNLAELRAAWRFAAHVQERTTPCFNVVNAGGGEAKLYVYDEIGAFDNDAGEFVKAVHALDAKNIGLHINSPGGFVFDAVSMFEALEAHTAKVAVHVDGLAASAASFLAMVGDSVDIAKGGRMMIHDAQGVGIGGPADMREYADLLEAVSNDIAGYYSRRAGGKPTDWRAAMQKTTWYSADESVAAKLADRVTGDGKKKDGPDNRTRLIRARALVALKGVK